MKRSRLWGCLMLALTGTFSGSGCRTTRPEVPPPPTFARDGQKIGGKGIGFGSAPRAGYMTDASTQLAPGIAAPGGDRTSVASVDGVRESPGTAIKQDSGTKGTLGRMFDGLGSAASSSRKDESVSKAGYEPNTPASLPIDPPVSLPPPPLIPPPAATGSPAPPPQKSMTESSPQPLPDESELPPPIPGSAP